MKKSLLVCGSDESESFGLVAMCEWGGGHTLPLEAME